MRLLIVGGSGFLGAELVRQALAGGHEVAATSHTQAGTTPEVDWHRLDVRHREDVAALVRTLRPDIILNAAYRQSEWATTANGPAYLALAAVAVGARLVHVSSDAVFSGSQSRYHERCVPDPVSAYGAAKAAAETALEAIAPQAVVARTSLILGDGGSGHKTSPHEALVHALTTSERSGVLFTDDVRCPVHVSDLASALLELAASEHAGVHHVAGPDAISRYDLGLLVAERDGLDADALPAGRRADTDVPGPIAVRLGCEATQDRLRTRLRGAREFLRATHGHAQ